jgi:3-hydroxyisobutyrate dehydrogenase-like beta-hydroxyacid dehydrogenase
MSETIGFIGLGNMGQPIAANLLRAGYKLRVYNRTPGKDGPLVAGGAVSVARSNETAELGGVVLTMLTDDAALENVCTQPASFIEKLGPGGIHISLSTVSPAISRRMAEHHAKFGVAFVSAPVFGRPDAAAAARLWICVSGPEKAKSRVAPILKAIGQGTFDFGEDAGAANVVKLCGNFLIASAIEGLAEGFVFAEKNGVPASQLADMLGQTFFACTAYRNYSKIIAEKLYEPPGFRLILGLKDMNLVLDAATSASVPMPLASLLRDRWLSSLAKGRGNLDWSGIALAAADDAGMNPPPPTKS